MAEETFDEFSGATREDELGTFVAALDVFDVDFDTATDSVILAVDLLGAWDDTVGATEVDTNEARLDARDGTGNDGADFVFEGGEDGIVLGLAEALDDNLLSSHGSDAAK